MILFSQHWLNDTIVSLFVFRIWHKMDVKVKQQLLIQPFHICTLLFLHNIGNSLHLKYNIYLRNIQNFHTKWKIIIQIHIRYWWRFSSNQWNAFRCWERIQWLNLFLSLLLLRCDHKKALNKAYLFMQRKPPSNLLTIFTLP